MAEKLQKKLGLLEVFCIASGAMISSGIFILPGLAFAQAGPAVILSYFIAGLACVPTIMSMSELASAMPKAGGDYFYIVRGFGPLVGMIAGFGSWFALSFKSAWALIGMGIYINTLFSCPVESIAVGLCVFFVVLNIIGVKEASRFQVFMVVYLIGIMVLYIIRGLPHLNTARFTPFFPKGPLAMFGTASFVFVAYGGLTKIVAVAEEIDRPERNLFLGMVISLSVIVVLYVLMVMVTVGVVEPDILAGTLMPIIKGAEAFSGRIFHLFIGISAALAFLTTANAGIMSASRYLLGMSRDRYLPGVFQKIGSRFQTPYVAIVSTGIFMSCAILALKLEILVKIGSVIFLLLYIFANATVILFRESRIANYRPTFHAPFYPYLQIAGILLTGFLLLEVSTGVLFLTLIFIFASAMVYKYTTHKGVIRDSALLHIIRRLVKTDKRKLIKAEHDLSVVDVSTELKEIVISRDNIKDDIYYQRLKYEVFDDIIKRSSVVDIQEMLKIEPFFRRVADVLSKELRISKLELLRSFMEREKVSSTIIEDGIAIPHLIIDGKGMFKILFVRSKEGIIFPDGRPVHIAVVVVSSADLRHLHFRMLGYFVNMVKDQDFSNDWFLHLEDKHLVEKVFAFISRKILPSPGPSRGED